MQQNLSIRRLAEVGFVTFEKRLLRVAGRVLSPPYSYTLSRMAGVTRISQ